MKQLRQRAASREPGGFTLIELLVVIAIIAVLAGVAVAAKGSARAKADTVACASNLRQLGTAVQLYGADHGGEFPRSFHSAGAHREPGWMSSIAPYLGGKKDEAGGSLPKTFRCPSDQKRDLQSGSYGLNVFFELTPDGDDYVGAPASWRVLLQVPSPSRTILLAEVRSASGGMGADHLMCHQWSSLAGAKNALAHDRHNGRANYLFVDGHVESLPVESTFVSRSENLWNPSVAGLAGSTP